jgi:formate dehydrogenase iron-sulfur subunit
VPEVAKLIDVSKCIGCKACQVACMEWNDLRDEVGTNVGVYDNPMDLTAQSWTVMRFAEVEPEPNHLEWLIRKDGCMHCDDPGCLKACPRPAPSSSTPTASSTSSGALHRLRLLRHRLPVQRPAHLQKDNKAYKCTLCSDRVGWAWSRPASRPARPAPSPSAPRRTWDQARSASPT